MYQEPDSAVFITAYSDKQIESIDEFYFLINKTESDKDIDSMDIGIINYIESNEIIKQPDIYNHLYKKLSSKENFKTTDKFYLQVRYYSYYHGKYLYFKAITVKNEIDRLVIE